MLNKDAVSKYFLPLSPIPTHVSPGGSMDRSPKCILFDIYGTLFISDSGDIHAMQIPPDTLQKIRALLDAYQITKSAEHMISEYIEAISKTHRDLKRKGIDFPEVRIEKIWKDITNLPEDTSRYLATEFELLINPVFPMPHLKGLLTACRSSNIVMGLISNAQFYTEYLFHWFLGSTPEQLGFCRDLIFYSYLSEHAKPSLFMFFSALTKLKEMGIASHSVLYLGNDMQKDILPAKRVGFKTALFAGDARSLRLRKNEPDCKDIQPDIVITELNQLLQYL